MTITSNAGSDLSPQTEMVTVVVDGVAIEIPKGTLVIRAAELLGIEIPRFAITHYSNRSLPAACVW